MSVQELIREAQSLSAEERKLLMQALAKMQDTPDVSPKKRNLLELAGLGQELWDGIDAQEYINQLRSEWDHRP